MCAPRSPLDPALRCSLPPPPSSPSVPRIPHPQFVPLGVGVGRVVCWVHRSQGVRLAKPLLASVWWDVIESRTDPKHVKIIHLTSGAGFVSGYKVSALLR